MKKFLLGFVLAFGFVCAGAYGQGGGLFIHDSKSALGVQSPSDDPGIMRSAPVQLDSGAIPTPSTPPGTIVVANVFADVSLSIVLDTLRYTSETSYAWSGHVLGEPDTSTAVFTIFNGVMVANIHSTTQGTFQLRMTQDGVPSIREIDLAKGGTCGVQGHVHDPITPASIKSLGIPKGGNDVFDILAVYTPAARDGAGGDDGIQAIIQLTMDEFNTVLDDSLVVADVRLVHIEEISYTETGSATFNNALSDLQGTSDGEMDSVHALRDTYGADFVTLYLDDVEGTSTLGLAYVGDTGDLISGDGDFAFSTVQYDASSLWVLAHEIGHNLGNQHESGGTPISTYSRGYNGGSFCTVMCASVGPSSVGHFSNPTTGHGITNVRDVARSIDEVATVMSGYRSRASVLSVLPSSTYYTTLLGASDASPSSKTYTLTNLGSSGSISWTAAVSESWLSLNSSSGSLSASATADVIVSVNGVANSLDIGDHTATLTITDTTHAAVTEIDVELNIPVFAFNMDSDPGWTTGTGWAHGTPTGGTATNGNPDPTEGFTGSNVYGVNLSGSVPGGVFDTSPSYLKTTAIDLSSATNTTLTFRRWLNGFGSNQSATATVDVSNNDSTWTNLYSIPATGNFDSTWNLISYDISAVADGESTVYIRWGYSTTDAGLHPSFFPATGWNIDDVVIAGNVDIPPTVTTAAATSVAGVSAIGNGNITDLGAPNPTAHGVVWGTSSNPTLADSSTDEGAVSATGAFTSKMTGLTPGQMYHYRAYATNSGGTVYGADQTFTTLNLIAETWVDFAHVGTESGSEIEPFSSFEIAIDTVTVGGTVKLKGDTATNESEEAGITIDREMTIEAINGNVRIGVSP